MKSFVAAAAISAFAGAAMAEAASEWELTAQVYLWGAGLSGTTSSGQSIDLDFGDVLEKLDFAFMGSLIAQRDRVFTFADLIYLNVSEGRNAAVGPGIPAVADGRIKGTVLTGGIGYDFARRDGDRLAPFAGTRVLRIDTTVNLAVGPGSARFTSKDTYWDAIVGISGHTPLTSDWALSYYADVGAGESDLTWQALVTFDRKFESWTLSFGYRHMAWEFPSGSTLADVSFSGPVIGAKFRF